MEIKTKADIGTTIYYLHENRVHSAPVLSIKLVANQKDAEEKAHTDVQKDIYLHFGTAGVWYRTVHGIYPENQIFLTREALGTAIVNGIF